MSEKLLVEILLATDGSEDAETARRAAVDLAVKTTSGLHLVQAWRPLPHYSYPSFAPEGYSSPEEREARELLEEQETLAERGGADIASSHLERGRPADVVLRVAEEIGAGLIVLGSRGRGPVRRVLLGSVSEGVVHHAGCPVLVVRGEDTWPPTRVVVGDDGSEAAARAGEVAVRLGGFLGIPVRLARAAQRSLDIPDLPADGPDAYGRAFEEYLRESERSLEERADALEGLSGVRPDVDVLVGDASAMLEELGEESTLIVLGSRGLGAVERMRLGSVSTKALRAVRGPVMICPPGGPFESG